jgi:hypothetical protein
MEAVYYITAYLGSMLVIAAVAYWIAAKLDKKYGTDRRH